MKYLGFFLLLVGSRLVTIGSRMMGFHPTSKIEFRYGMTYIGSNERLIGKTAMVKIVDGVALAQFDDLSLYESHFWHPFHIGDFE